MIVIASGLYS